MKKSHFTFSLMGSMFFTVFLYACHKEAVPLPDEETPTSMTSEQRALLVDKVWGVTSVTDMTTGADSTGAFIGYTMLFRNNGNYEHNYNGTLEQGTYMFLNSRIYLTPDSGTQTMIGNLTNVIVTAANLGYDLNFADSTGQSITYRVAMTTN